jgi:hypothetical protein
VHGFRSAFRDWAAECTNFPNEVCEAALAHVVRNKVEAAYRRGDLLDKRRELMEVWGAYCTAPAVAKRSLSSLKHKACWTKYPHQFDDSNLARQFKHVTPDNLFG